MKTTSDKTFRDLLIIYKKNKTAITLYIAGQQASLFGIVTEVGKDFIVFANKGQDSEAHVVIPLIMLSAIMPNTDLQAV